MNKVFQCKRTYNKKGGNCNQHENEDEVQTQEISSGPIRMITYREEAESGSESADEAPQPRRQRRRRARKKDGGAFELAAPSRDVITGWIAEAWRNLTTTTIVGVLVLSTTRDLFKTQRLT
ncbi:hypothetical protein PHYSODRAFT_288934 [Phytophthora sojae]|uniref:Uncharacterized protein n=1 Tax=Phytophthora sojae (strain P6497) TaxID=1094619 RepID=G5AAP7_PHYSP|nr:hypothetical protein PHYSODRAFT_288934 [Phytophthora sojae]EGZ07676.1 hypothetical protein PHYSODRAFT_288934 [Phytophthora sojae]|eukprot:XP_009537242.1 hypothetical protein PHYSODRAFT_288934 [Phytophthora sojae]